MDQLNDILIYGAGGFGREVACLVHAINRINPAWNLLGFLDDGLASGTVNEYGKVLGGIDILNAMPSKTAVAIAIADPSIVEKIVAGTSHPEVWFPNLIAPNAFFFDENNVSLGKGNLITFGCRISCKVKLGNFNILNGQISLGHDVSLGDFNVMMPETRISGETSIGNSNFFGARSLVLQRIKIGNNTRIGSGSIVMRKTKDGMSYFGNPAKIIGEK